MKLTNEINILILITIFLIITTGCNSIKLSEKETSEKEINKEAVIDENESEASGEVSINMQEEAAASDTSDAIETVQIEPKKLSKQTVVKFGKGKVSRGYENSIIRGEKHTYIIGASKGQRMSINVKSLEDNADFSVTGPSGDNPIAGTNEQGVTSFNEVLRDSGKYKVVVSPTRGNSTFKINFKVSAKEKVNPPDTSGRGGRTKVVKFGKGKSSARYSGAVIRAERDTYILGASGGQVMSVSISSLENNAVFSIVSPTGGSMVSESRNWSGQLPANGKYKIIVSGTRGNATYKVNFAVR